MVNNFTMSGYGLSRGRLHTIVTHAFSHYNLMHFGKKFKIDLFRIQYDYILFLWEGSRVNIWI